MAHGFPVDKPLKFHFINILVKLVFQGFHCSHPVWAKIFAQKSAFVQLSFSFGPCSLPFSPPLSSISRPPLSFISQILVARQWPPLLRTGGCFCYPSWCRRVPHASLLRPNCCFHAFRARALRYVLSTASILTVVSTLFWPGRCASCLAVAAALMGLGPTTLQISFCSPTSSLPLNAARALLFLVSSSWLAPLMPCSWDPFGTTGGITVIKEG